MAPAWILCCSFVPNVTGANERSIRGNCRRFAHGHSLTVLAQTSLGCRLVGGGRNQVKLFVVKSQSQRERHEDLTSTCTELVGRHKQIVEDLQDQSVDEASKLTEQKSCNGSTSPRGGFCGW
jgi:hypothetical protein